MEKIIVHIMNALKREKLTEYERLAMRRKLELFMSEHPLRAPLFVRLREHFVVARMPSYYFRPQAQLAAFTLVVVLFTSVGTSYAAESALPGDALYLVKVNVNEPVMGAFAFSDEAKAEWGVALAERRLEEAEVLAAEGRLSVSDSAALASSISKSTNAFNKRIAALASVRGNDDLVEDAKFDLETSLSAHEHVLTMLGNELPDVQHAVAPVVAAIQQNVDVPAVVSTSSAPAIPNTGIDKEKEGGKKDEKRQSAVKKLVALRQKQAKEQLDDVRDIAQSARQDLSTTTFAFVSDAASSTMSSFDKAHQDADEGDYDQALQSLTQSIQASKEAKAGLQAALRIRHDGRRASKEKKIDKKDAVTDIKEATSTPNTESYPHDREKKSRNRSY